MGYVVTHARRNRCTFTKRSRIVVKPTVPTNRSRDISEVLTSNDWSGKRCFIIGGGDSLRNFSYSCLDNELTIGINRAFEVCDSTINYSMDAFFHNWMQSEASTDKGAKRLQKWKEFRGFKVFLENPGTNFGMDNFIVKRRAERSISLSLKRGIYGGNNSGFGALMLAIALGSKEIYLLGFDMKTQGERTHWHEGYPGQNKERMARVLPNFAKLFEEFAPHLSGQGIKIFNLNPDSALECFPKMLVSDVLTVNSTQSVVRGDAPMIKCTGKYPSTFPVIISFYTRDTGYEDEAKKLADSLNRLNLDYEIIGIADRKNWQLNIRYKPSLISKMLKRYHPRPILYVDADAVFMRFPDLFRGILGDIGVHRVHWEDYGRNRPDEVLGGTIYVSNCARTQSVLEKWIQGCETRSLSVWDQKILQEIIGNDFYQLPAQYCTIFDSMGSIIKDPVILHNQASRRLKSGFHRIVRPAKRIKLNR
jgi:hypothetical protein